MRRIFFLTILGVAVLSGAAMGKPDPFKNVVVGNNSCYMARAQVTTEFLTNILPPKMTIPSAQDMRPYGVNDPPG